MDFLQNYLPSHQQQITQNHLYNYIFACLSDFKFISDSSVLAGEDIRCRQLVALHIVGEVTIINFIKPHPQM